MSGMNMNSRRTLAIDGQQSLLGAINRFVQAVDSMDDTVMIPCRLRDLPVDSLTTSTICEENNNKAIVPAAAAHMNGDLYDFYAMLHVIRSEIIAGPKATVTAVDESNDNLNFTESINENDTVSENARKTAAAFRFHLRGLFGLLHQLTETAKVLSSKYERDVTAAQTGISSVSSFNM